MFFQYTENTEFLDFPEWSYDPYECDWWCGQ